MRTGCFADVSDGSPAAPGPLGTLTRHLVPSHLNLASAGCGPKHAAKEVKIFVLSDFVTRRYRTLADAIYEDNKDVATRCLGEPLELGAQLRRTHLLAAGALEALRAKMRSTVGIVFHLLGAVFCLKSAEAVSRVLDEGPRRKHSGVGVSRLVVSRPRASSFS